MKNVPAILYQRPFDGLCDPETDWCGVSESPVAFCLCSKVTDSQWDAARACRQAGPRSALDRHSCARLSGNHALRMDMRDERDEAEAAAWAAHGPQGRRDSSGPAGRVEQDGLR